MKEYAAPFSTEEVQAILDGSKIQDRVVIKIPKWMSPMRPDLDKAFNGWPNCPSGEYLKVPCSRYCIRDDIWGDCETVQRLFCPYEIGDRLWVRETWAYGSKKQEPNGVIYKADDTPLPNALERGSYSASIGWGKWSPAIFMPRWASRITLEITGLRAEKLQDIIQSDADMRAEGIPLITYANNKTDWGEMAYQFSLLWDSRNAKKGYPFESNPFIWVREWKRV